MLEEVISMTFGAALKQAREELKLTQMELSKEVGISFSSINRYENGKHYPTPIVLNAIRSFFETRNVTFDYEK